MAQAGLMRSNPNHKACLLQPAVQLLYQQPSISEVTVLAYSHFQMEVLSHRCMAAQRVSCSCTPSLQCFVLE